MRDHILSNPEKIAGLLANEKLQLDSNFSPFLTFKCKAICCETKQSRGVRSYLKNLINVDNCFVKFKQNQPFPPRRKKIMS